MLFVVSLLVAVFLSEADGQARLCLLIVEGCVWVWVWVCGAGGGGGGGQGDLSYLIVGRSAVAPASNLEGCWDQFCDFLLDYFEEFQLKKTSSFFFSPSIF